MRMRAQARRGASAGSSKACQKLRCSVPHHTGYLPCFTAVLHALPCPQYFLSCTQRDTRLFLATLHLDLRGKATSKEPGPYHTCNW